MNKQQTAVEWLVEQMFKQGYFDGNKPLTFTNLNHLQQQAKEMEKEQIIEAFKHGELPPLFVNFDAEQYYDKKFKSKL